MFARHAWIADPIGVRGGRGCPSECQLLAKFQRQLDDRPSVDTLRSQPVQCAVDDAVVEDAVVEDAVVEDAVGRVCGTHFSVLA